MTILELGCGSGAFTADAARKVGPEGIVHALDIQKKMLTQLETKLRQPAFNDIKNVQSVLGNACQIPYSSGSLDLVFMVTVLPEIPDQDKALEEIKRVLKPGGIIAVSELLLDPDYMLRSTVIKRLKKHDFKIDSVEGNLWQYTVRGIKDL